MRTIRTIFAIAAVALSGAVFAAEAAQRIQISTQSLATALMEFSKQTDIVIVAPAELVQGKVAPQVSGELLPADALQQLLKGSGLGYSRGEEGEVTIVDGRSAGNDARNLQMQVAEGQGATPGNANGVEQNNEPVGTSASETKKSDVQEIIVTAQKREEKLQDVPISISVLGGEDLDRSTAEGVTEALRSVPGVTTTVAGQGGGTQITVRGVSAGAPTLAGSSAVAYYLDSIPFGFIDTAFVPDANVYDLNRVEVLRGPQGTLYGSSALNGVVRILTNDADLNAFAFKGRTSLSFTEDGGENYRGDMAVNVPIIVDKIAIRAVVGYQALSGWIDKPNNSDANDGKISTARLKVNAKPTEQLSIGLSAWISRSDYGAPPFSLASDSVRSSRGLDEPISADYNIFSLTIGYDFQNFSVASSTSHIAYENDGFQDRSTPARPTERLQSIFESDVLTQEVNINSTHNGPWRWTLGAIYRDAQDGLFQLFGLNTPFAPVDFYDNSQSFAGFGEVTREFFDSRLELTAGLRYFEDDYGKGEYQDFALNSGPANGLFSIEKKFDKTSPRVTLTWHPSTVLTAYASYAEGFRSGAEQGETVKIRAPQIPALNPDYLRNYELGAKGSLWGGRLTFDSAIYYLDWQDVQYSIGIPFGNAFISARVNGVSASGLGFEFASAAEIAEGLTLGVNFGLSDLTNDEDVVSQTASGPVLFFAKGSRANFSPKYVAGASADYTFTFGSNGYKGRLSASANYNSELYRRTLSGTIVTVRPSDKLLFGRAGFSIESPHRWTASLYADNISNEQGAYLAGDISSTDLRPRPRTIGMQFEYRY